MYKKFFLTLNNELDIEFDLIDNGISQLWAQEIANDYPLYETERFYGWPNSVKNIDYYINELNDCIDKLPYDIKKIDSYNQEYLNYLHRYFETLRGPIDVGTITYNNSTETEKSIIDRFNILIHETEHYLRHSDNPELVCTYSNRPRILLSEDHYDLFTFKWEYGTVYINYCEVGKTILDVFKDNDELVENVKPLEYYSSDFMIKFGLTTLESVYQYRLKQINKFIKEKNFNFKHNSLGYIPVARLSKHVSIDTISKHQKVTKTCVK